MQTNGVKSRDPVVVRSAGSVVAVRPGGDDLATTDLMRSNSRASGSAPGLVTRTPRNPPSKVWLSPLWTWRAVDWDARRTFNVAGRLLVDVAR
jgi:hypothetical protein